MRYIIFDYKNIANILAEIEPFTEICNVKEIVLVELIKKINEFIVMPIQWLS